MTSAGDAALDTGEGFIEASNGLVADEYRYDANGNITKDDNKGLTDIDYNILNLPRQVVQANGDVITYVYDAAGIKLAKTVDDGSPETTYYDGPFHYIGNTLQFIQTAEGRTQKSGTNFLYEYNLTDHLGNVRVSVDATGTVVQRDGYYPFGLTFNHSNVSPENDYKYNGFEEQKETGWYDYLARFYDPSLGRFLNVDPAADLMRRHSVYSYAFNNPVRFIDPDGMVPTDGYSEQGSHQAYDYHAHSQAASDSPVEVGGSKKKKKQNPKQKTTRSLKKAMTGDHVQDRLDNIVNEFEVEDFITSRTIFDLVGVSEEESSSDGDDTKDQRKIISQIDKIVKTEDGFTIMTKGGEDVVETLRIMQFDDDGNKEVVLELSLKIRNKSKVNISSTNKGGTKVDIDGVSVGKGFVRVAIPTIKINENKGSIFGIPFPINKQ